MSFDRAPSIRQCLAHTDLPRLEKRMLLEHVLKKPRAWLLAHDDECLDELTYRTYLDLVERRRHGTPMAYLVGTREFMSFELCVSPDVLIPRPETELLVECGLSTVAQLPSPRILDLGTGSGAVAIAVALARPDAQVMATDVSPDALEVARSNALRLNANIEFYVGSWYEPLMAQRGFDLILSNPPYIHAKDSHLDQGDLRFEPRQALTDGQDGMSAIRCIILESDAWLTPGGRIFLEHGFDQGEIVRQLLADNGFEDIRTVLDLAGHERVSGAIKPEH